MITVGIDIGSITAKSALIKDNKLLGSKVSFTGYNAEKAGQTVFNELISEHGIEAQSVDKIVSTGYGRNMVKFAHKALTEIICHGAGASFLIPEVRSVIDIGGQDSKVILLDSKGKVLNFAMNDKCAAGTGRFLEVMARAMEVSLNDFGEMSNKALDPATISSTCTVFAESEVISLISKGENRENIIAGIHEAVASRVSALAHRVGLQEPIIMTGGVSLNGGIIRAMEKKLKYEIKVLDSAQVNGAIGAAVLAQDLA